MNENKTQEKIALAVMRIQPLHKGHFNLISKMLQENDTVIIGLGSTQIEEVFDNPYSKEERSQMIKKAFGEGSVGKKGKIKIINLRDIKAVNAKEWAEYVFSQIKKQNLNLPTRYYAGSKTDAYWFQDFEKNQKSKIKSIYDCELEIKVLNRYTDSINMSGTDIRKSIANGTGEWKEFVPECLLNYVEEVFPKKFVLEEIIKRKELINFD